LGRNIKIVEEVRQLKTQKQKAGNKVKSWMILKRKSTLSPQNYKNANHISECLTFDMKQRFQIQFSGWIHVIEVMTIWHELPDY
jgi:hypothetical protein